MDKIKDLFGDNKNKFIAGCGCFCILLIVSIILLSCSVRIIEVEQYGLLYNTVTKSLKNETYESGRKFAGLGKSFRKFSVALHDIDFSKEVLETPNLDCWTKNGVNVYISLGFFFRVIKDRIYNLYMAYGTEDEDVWRMPLIRAAATAIKETTTKHNATEFFENRALIKTNILAAIKETIKNNLDDSIEIIDLQFRSVTIDDNFETAIIAKLIQLQELRTYQIKQEAAKILKQTEIIEAYAETNITLIQAEAQAKGEILIAKAKAEAFALKIKNEAEAYAKLKTQLGFDNHQLMRFLYINEAAQFSPNSTLLNTKQIMIKHTII